MAQRGRRSAGDSPGGHGQASQGPRRRHGSNNLVDLGEDSAGRAIQQVLALTAQARATLHQRGTPNTGLLLGRRAKALEGGRVFADGTTAEHAIKAWSDSAGLVGGDGAEHQ